MSRLCAITLGLLTLTGLSHRVDAAEIAPFLTISGQGLDGLIGYSIAEIGDVNGDGRVDLVLGAPNIRGHEGHAYVYCTGNTADSVPCLTLSMGPREFDQFNFGLNLASIGDFNGDGRGDLIVGGPLLFGTGAALVFYGGERTHGTPDLVLGPPLPYSEIPQMFGRSLSGAGDVNGDGFDDLIVGAPWWTEYFSATGVGQANVFLGSATPDSVVDLVLDTPSPRHPGASYHFGYSVARAGDMNGDGHPDLAVAQEGTPYGPPCYGTTYIYYGGPGFDSIPDRTLKMTPFEQGILGSAVASASDFNADGFDDLVVLAAEESGRSCASLPGHLYVYFGSRDAPSIQDPNLILSGDPPDDIGSSLFGGRDVNGDGYPDIIAGAASVNGYGKVYIFFGGPGADPRADVTLHGQVYAGYFGRSVSALDVNGDGVSDVVVGAPGIPGVPGRVYVYDLSTPLAARAFVPGEHRTIPLELAPARTCVRIEPASGSYETTEIDFSTIRMVSEGTGSVSEIAAMASRRVTVGDTDGNGITEVSVCFARSDLSHLLSSIRGKRAVSVAIEGCLTTGRRFRAPLDLTVLGTPAANPKLVASISPNPLNPRGTLKFTMAAPGYVTARLFDISGRLVRTIVEPKLLEAGEHALVIEGQEGNGAPMATGVYFYRVTTPDGMIQGRFVVAK